MPAGVFGAASLVRDAGLAGGAGRWPGCTAG